MPASTPPLDRPRVVHVVTGGFSGATQVAVDLCLAALHSGPHEPVLVLRLKRHTPLARVDALRAQGLRVLLLPGWSHLHSIWRLSQWLREMKPLAVLAHGFPEHLIGRHAGVWAGVPTLIQVEHNSRERYTPWSRWQSRWLAQRSQALVGVSAGVCESLQRQGLPAEKLRAIPNGIDLTRFPALTAPREAGLVMSARFARQKDHATLVRALALLPEPRPRLLLAGGGVLRLRQRAEALAKRLGLGDRVVFLGHHVDVPGLLRSQRICVLATHFEGMPLALVEGMAAGCACVASDVVGVRGVIEPEVTGLLVPAGQPQALAAAIARLLADPALAERLGQAARARAVAEHGLALMCQRYQELITETAPFSARVAATTAGHAASARA